MHYLEVYHAKHLRVFQIPALNDNYVYVLHDTLSRKTAVVDPAEERSVSELLERENYRLSLILNTHHHLDHVGGNKLLKSRFSCEVYSSAYDKSRIPTADRGLIEGDVIMLGRHRIEVISTPGHTLGHIVYWLPEHELLFSGDTVFVMGCGRLFEGDAEMMWSSLQKILALPATTRIFCAHEYTLANARFAARVGHLPPSFPTYLEELQAKRSAFIPTVPTTLADERLYNPFLKAGDEEWAAAVGMPRRPAAEVFAALRQRKDIDVG